MRKTIVRNVALVWLASAGVLAASFLLFEHEEINEWGVVNYSVQLLLFILSVALVRHDPNRQNKYLFLNFAVLFGLFVFFHIYQFIPSSAGYIKLYLFEYIGVMGYYSLIAFSIVYLTVDLLFRKWSTVTKYLLAFSIVGGFVILYFNPLIVDPLYIYSTNDARDFSNLEAAFSTYKETHGVNPSADQLSGTLLEAGTVSPSSNEAVRTRVEELYPYLLSSESYAVLLVKPLYKNIVYMCIVSIFFILVFFGYQLYKDPPQGAYVEKIMSLFLLFLGVEVLHAYSFMKSVEWSTFYSIVSSGQVISAGILLLIAGVFILRLRFVISPNGEFYEQEIATSPGGVTRWRDMFDDLIITHFINNSRRHVGRIFVDKNQVS